MSDPSPSSPVDFFRREAINHHLSRGGAVFALGGINGAAATAIVGSLLLLGGLYLATAKYARRETVRGTLEPAAGSIAITADRAGLVSRVYASNGISVKAGQPLFDIRSDPVDPHGQRLGEVLEGSSQLQLAMLDRQTDLQSESLRLQQVEARNTLDASTVRLKGLARELDVQKARTALANQTLASAKELRDKGLMSELQYRQREDTYLANLQAALQIEQRIHDERERVATLASQMERRRVEAASEATTLNSTRIQLQEKSGIGQIERNNSSIATVDGKIASFQVKAGNTVSAGQSLGVIVPNNSLLQAEVWLPSRSVGFVRPGDRVKLMYDAFPFQRFGFGTGTVNEVSSAPTPPAAVPFAMEAKEPLYKVTIKIDEQSLHAYGKQWNLVPGASLKADIVLDQQTILVWMFDKLRAAQRRSDPIK